MISYIKGPISFKSPTYVVVEAGGIGYQIHISLHTYARIEKLETVKLLTHFIVKEDSQSLFGFAEEEERQLFAFLLSVSGVGANTARLLLSGMSPDELRAAILSENLAAFRQVKGIGPKTAKQIILDLKDKIAKEGGEAPQFNVAAADNTHREEALQALLALGFNKIQVQKALNQALREQPAAASVEELIKRGLKLLA